MISKIFKIMMTFLLIGVLSQELHQLKACTSFAVYSSKGIYYGLNLDWYNRELKFSIIENNGYKYFQLDFLEGGQWLTSVGFNEHGYLTTSQVADPAIDAQLNSYDNPIDPGMFYRYTIANFNSTEDMIQFLESSNTRITQVDYISIHCLCAGMDTSAAIVETGEDSNKITRMENNFIVMTNFNNYKYWGEPYTKVSGLGADRYKTAYKYIDENIEKFGFESAFEVLNKTQDASGTSRTRCSMVFAPEEKAVYIVIQRNFAQVYKLSLVTNTIETYSGFTNYFSEKVDENGITSTQLNVLTGVETSDKSIVANEFRLLQNYPNPFNPSTIIEFSIPKHSYVSLTVYDILGREVCKILNGYMHAGLHSINYDAAGLSAGIYFYKLEAGGYISIKKMSLIK